jgi:hypothetical protein
VSRNSSAYRFIAVQCNAELERPGHVLVRPLARPLRL